MQHAPIDHRTLLRRIAELEQRVRSLETSPRAGNTSISSGKLIVGAPGGTDRIELDARYHQVTFNSADGAAEMYAPGGISGAILKASSDAGSPFADFGVQGIIWAGSFFTTLQVSRVAGDGSTTPQAEISASVNDSGGGNSSADVSLTSTGVGDSDSSAVTVMSDAGLVLDNKSRTTDPPTPAAGSVVMYVKNNRLYNRDSTGAVHGPL